MKSRLDFQAVYAKGKSVANRAAVVYVLPHKGSSVTQVGFAVGRKLGKAVIRNRVRRRIREAVRLLWPRVRPGVLLVIIGRQAALDMPWSKLQANIAELLTRAGVLKAES